MPQRLINEILKKNIRYTNEQKAELFKQGKYDELLENHLAMVYSLALKYNGIFGEDIDELFSAGSIAVFQAFKKIKPEKSMAMGRYLKVTAENAMKAVLNKAARVTKHEAQTFVPIEDLTRELTAEQTKETDDTFWILLRLIDKLPESKKEIINGMLEGKSFSEMAQEQGKTNRDIYQNYYTTKRQLKDQLTKIINNLNENE